MPPPPSILVFHKYSVMDVPEFVPFPLKRNEIRLRCGRRISVRCCGRGQRRWSGRIVGCVPRKPAGQSSCRPRLAPQVGPRLIRKKYTHQLGDQTYQVEWLQEKGVEQTKENVYATEKHHWCQTGQPAAGWSDACAEWCPKEALVCSSCYLVVFHEKNAGYDVEYLVEGQAAAYYFPYAADENRDDGPLYLLQMWQDLLGGSPFMAAPMPAGIGITIFLAQLLVFVPGNRSATFTTPATKKWHLCGARTNAPRSSLNVDD
eukprot:CAMPEP_0178999188 /NCGR_PEP_ID=MMETSP0795-20121207/9914_1 /TAXON_ID=88552 /ORGANISM="Amoebophrya sp., Strain Ameob2" /LENGTH=259 /DNA_ID=CAMNT_0020691919 /DNA_START=317 /DNA_END=1098 /DNA_ORIENTATION=+